MQKELLYRSFLVTLQFMTNTANKKSRGGIIARILLSLILCPVILIAALMVVLHLPAVQNYAISRACEIAKDELGYDVEIRNFRLSFPLKVTINDFKVVHSSDTLLNGRQIGIDLRAASLFKGEVEVNYISIDNTDVDTHSLIDDVHIKGHIGHARTTARSIVPEEERANIRWVHIADTEADITLYDGESKKDSTSSPVNWIISLYKGNIQNSGVRISIPSDSIDISTSIERLALYSTEINLRDSIYSVKKVSLNNGQATYNKGEEHDSIAPYNHIGINNICIESTDILYSNSKIAATIGTLKLKQQNGITISDAGVNIKSSAKNININNLHINSTSESRLKGNITLPKEALNGDISGRMSADIQMQINKSDLSQFLSPQQYARLDVLTDTLIYCGISASGNMKHMDIDTLYAEIPRFTRVGMRGNIGNIDNIEKSNGEITISAATTDLYRIIHMQSTPDSIKKEATRIRGSISLANQLLKARTHIATSSKGRSSISVQYNISNNSYSTKIRARNISTENILPQTPLHSVDFTVNGRGRGYDLLSDTTRYKFDLQIDTLCYDSIMLRNIALEATQNRGESKINIESADSTLLMKIVSNSSISSSEIINHSEIDIESINLEALKIVSSPLDVKMHIDIEGYSDMQQKHALKIAGKEFKLVTPKRTYTPAPLVFNGFTSPDTSFVNLETGDLHIKGNMPSGYKRVESYIAQLKEMYKSASKNERTLYYLHDYQKNIPAVTIDASCGQDNILSNLLRFNNLDYKNISFSLSVDSVNGINGQGGIYQLNKDEILIDTIRFMVHQRDEFIRYFAGVRTRSLDPENPKLKFYSALYGTLVNDSLTTKFLFRDNNDNVGADIQMNTIFSPKNLYINFTPKATIFNKRFNFNNDNFVRIGSDLSIRTNIELTDSTGAGLRLMSMDTTMLRDISAQLINIDLKSVTGFIPYSPNISGLLDMELQYRDNNNGVLLTGSVRGTGLAYDSILIGNEALTLSYLPKGDNVHYTQVILRHNKRKIVDIAGDYYNDSQINGKVRIIRFPLELSRPFIKDTGIRLTGRLHGDISLKGTLEKANSNGYIRFDSIHADAPIFGTGIRINKNRAEIKSNKLQFKDLDIYAQGDTPFKINGTIDIENLLNPDFRLRMTADNYELINTPKQKNSMLYGRLLLDTDSDITGRLNSLNISGSATMLGSSNITYVMHETPLATESQLDGLVEFVNFTDTTRINKEEQELNLGNITLGMRLTIEEGARINTELDANRNNYIELQGGGNLNLTYSSEESLSLTGRYTLSDGELKYTLPIIPLKTFSISEGSYVYWTGDVANPALNITALERMTSSVTMDDGSTQAVMFNVGVELSNTLEDMGLSFTLSAPENAAVQNELDQLDKETLNKYAVTMLITGAYLGGKGGITVSNALSSFLDAQINEIAGDAMKTVDINVGIADVEDSETGSSYKNYSFSLAKRFWNDRFTVIIGGEVNSGEQNTKNESFINNVSLEWKINKEGNRFIRIFYDKNYESILEGEIIETGLGYIYKRRLNSLKELFIFRSKKDEKDIVIDKKENKPREE